MNTVVIFRYPSNRKYYSKNDSRYVNLTDVITYIKQGYSVEVYDKETNEDLTRKTMIKALDKDPNVTIYQIKKMILQAEPLCEELY